MININTTHEFNANIALLLCFTRDTMYATLIDIINTVNPVNATKNK